MKKEYYDELLKLSQSSYENDEVPVGAIIVKDGKIIGKGENEQFKSGLIHKHAEINAIEDVCKKLGKYELQGSEIYITLEPCLMCFGAIVGAKIKKIVYIMNSPKEGFTNFINLASITKKVNVEKCIFEHKNKEMLASFFKNKR